MKKTFHTIGWIIVIIGVWGMIGSIFRGGDGWMAGIGWLAVGGLIILFSDDNKKKST